MKLTNQKLLNIINNTAVIINRSLPVKASYAIAKNIDKLEKEGKLYNSERSKLIEKFAEKDEYGNIIIYDEGPSKGSEKIKKEHIKDWNNEITELLEIEIEVDIHKFKLDVISHCELSAQELRAIDFMIEE